MVARNLNWKHARLLWMANQKVVGSNPLTITLSKTVKFLIWFAVIKGKIQFIEAF